MVFYKLSEVILVKKLFYKYKFTTASHKIMDNQTATVVIF